MKSTGCVSSRDSPLRWHRRTHRWMRRKRNRATGGGPPEKWNPPPPSPWVAEAVVELVPVAGAEAPATRSSVGGARGRHGGTGGRDGGSPEPLRKRRRGFSNLR
jgi:hypothetical protein